VGDYVYLKVSPIKGIKRFGVKGKLAPQYCDTPGVSFVLRREIYPNLGCSVKISISRSRMSLIIETIHLCFTEFGVSQSHKRPILEPVKTFILGTSANSKKSFSNCKSHLKLIKSNS
jgi:hypothetical protein